MAVRNGSPSLRDIAHEMCRILAKYGAGLRVLYAENPDLMAALLAAQLACVALEAELIAVIPVGD